MEVELVCEPAFDYGRAPAEWTLVGRRPPHRRRDAAADTTIRLRTDMALGIEGDRVRAPPRAARGRASASARCPGRRTSPRRPTSTTANAALDATSRVLARLARTGALSRPPVARGDPAIGAGDQGPDLHADRRDGRRAHDLAARDAGRRAQLGLPLHVDARRHLHAAGAALAQARLGGRRVHAVHRRPGAERGRRRCRSCTASTAAAT